MKKDKNEDVLDAARYSTTNHILGGYSSWKPFFESKQAPQPKYATVEIERKKVGFLVIASKSATKVQYDDYEGACSTYPEASRLAAKLMKEMA